MVSKGQLVDLDWIASRGYSARCDAMETLWRPLVQILSGTRSFFEFVFPHLITFDIMLFLYNTHFGGWWLVAGRYTLMCDSVMLLVSSYFVKKYWKMKILIKIYNSSYQKLIFTLHSCTSLFSFNPVLS